MRREALISLALLTGVATVLVLVFWVARGWPDLPDCIEDLTPAQEREVDAFRSGFSPIHIGAGVVLAAAVWRLAARGRGERTPGPLTLIGLATALLFLAGPILDPEATAVAFVYIVLAWAAVPVSAVLLIVSLTLFAQDRRGRLGAYFTLIVLWLSLGIVLPAHYAAVGTVDESWCIGLD